MGVKRLPFMAFAAALLTVVLISLLSGRVPTTGRAPERARGTAAAPPSLPTARPEQRRDRRSIALPKFVPAPPQPPPKWFDSVAALRGHHLDAREAVWAPEMERALRARFDDLPPWLATLVVHDVECRTQSCRMEVRYPDALAQAASRRAVDEGMGLGEGPVGFLVLATGPMAHLSNGLKHEVVTDRGSDPTHRETFALAFDRQRLDQMRYEDWVASRQPAMEAVKKKIIDQERERAAAAAAGLENQRRPAHSASAATPVGEPRR